MTTPRDRGADQGHTLDATLIERLLVEVIACVVPDREAIYVSTPVTTGSRFVTWRRGPGASLTPGSRAYADAHRREVVEPNRREVEPLVARIRAQHQVLVINPADMDDVPGWQQDDYHRYWNRVIRRFAREVVFVDGWEYSVGCVSEFVCSVQAGLGLLDGDLLPLSPEDGAARIRSAIDDLDDGVLPRHALRRALTEIERALAPRGDRPAGLAR